jgi:predicted DNA-binding transcriptional regulator AlpA
MRVERAAGYLDISPSKFLQLVNEGKLPPPFKIDRVTMWDRLELDAAFESLKAAVPERPNTVDMVLGLKPNG